MPIAEDVDREGPRSKDRTTRRRNAVDRENTVQLFPRLSESKTRGLNVFSLINFRSKSKRRGVAMTAIFQAPKRSLPVFLALPLVLDDSGDDERAACTSSERFRALDKRSRGSVFPDTGLAGLGTDDITGAIDAAKLLSFVGW